MPLLNEAHSKQKGLLEPSINRTLDLARALIQVSDLETASESLLAHLFAISALTGDPPSVALGRLSEHLSDTHEWYTSYLPAIMGDPEEIGS